VEAGSRCCRTEITPPQAGGTDAQVENNKEEEKKEEEEKEEQDGMNRFDKELRTSRDPFDGYWLAPVLQEEGVSIRLCPDEGKPFDDSEDYYILDDIRAELSVPRWSAKAPLSVFRDRCIGSVMKNTFVHIAPPPPTMQEYGAHSRSRSLPRDFGSAKCIWSALRQAFKFAQAGPAEPSACTDSVSMQEAAITDAAAPLVSPRLRWSETDVEECLSPLSRADDEDEGCGEQCSEMTRQRTHEADHLIHQSHHHSVKHWKSWDSSSDGRTWQWQAAQWPSHNDDWKVKSWEQKSSHGHFRQPSAWKAEGWWQETSHSHFRQPSVWKVESWWQVNSSRSQRHYSSNWQSGSSAWENRTTRYYKAGSCWKRCDQEPWW